MLNIRSGGAVLSPLKLPLIQFIVLLLQFAHFFNFVKVDDKAGLQIV